jgi:hypothetical protein
MRKPRKYKRAEPLTEVVPLSPTEQLFSDETILALRELGAVLEPIYRRLRDKGYTVRDGKIYKSESVIE